MNVYMYQLAGRHQSLALQQRILMLRLLGCSSAQRVGLLCKALRVQGAGAERRSKGFERRGHTEAAQKSQIRSPPRA